MKKAPAQHKYNLRQTTKAPERLRHKKIHNFAPQHIYKEFVITDGKETKREGNNELRNHR